MCPAAWCLAAPGSSTIPSSKRKTEGICAEVLYYRTAEEVEEEIRKALHAVQMVAIDIEPISGKRVQEK